MLKKTDETNEIRHSATRFRTDRTTELSSESRRSDDRTPRRCRPSGKKEENARRNEDESNTRGANRHRNVTRTFLEGVKLISFSSRAGVRYGGENEREREWTSRVRETEKEPGDNESVIRYVSITQSPVQSAEGKRGSERKRKSEWERKRGKENLIARIHRWPFRPFRLHSRHVYRPTFTRRTGARDVCTRSSLFRLSDYVAAPAFSSRADRGPTYTYLLGRARAKIIISYTITVLQWYQGEGRVTRGFKIYYFYCDEPAHSLSKNYPI